MAAVAAVAVRAYVAIAAWTSNPLISSAKLDAAYYLRWAGDIASGDVLGTGGVLGGDPYLLNPLYAFVLAPLVGIFGPTPAPVQTAPATQFDEVT